MEDDKQLFLLHQICFLELSTVWKSFFYVFNESEYQSQFNLSINVVAGYFYHERCENFVFSRFYSYCGSNFWKLLLKNRFFNIALATFKQKTKYLPTYLF